MMALAFTACSSKRDVASVNQDQEWQQEQVERAQLLESQSSRIR